MKYVFLLWALCASLNAFSQDCDPATVAQKPGSWKEGMKGSVTGIPAADLEKEKKVVAAIHLMVKSKYSPTGVQADFNRSYDRPDSEVPVNFFDYNIYFLHYYCKDNVVKVDGETSTTLFISANRFDAKIYEKPDENNLPPEGFYSMKKMPVEKDGNYYFEAKAPLGLGVTGKILTWLITYDKKLPFTYVTKKNSSKNRKICLSWQCQRQSRVQAQAIRQKLNRIIKKLLRKSKHF